MPRGLLLDNASTDGPDSGPLKTGLGQKGRPRVVSGGCSMCDPKKQGWRERDALANNAPRLEEPGRMLAVGAAFFNRLGATGALRVIERPAKVWAFSHRHHSFLEVLKIKAHRRLEA